MCYKVNVLTSALFSTFSYICSRPSTSSIPSLALRSTAKIRALRSKGTSTAAATNYLILYYHTCVYPLRSRKLGLDNAYMEGCWTPPDLGARGGDAGGDVGAAEYAHLQPPVAAHVRLLVDLRLAGHRVSVCAVQYQPRCCGRAPGEDAVRRRAETAILDALGYYSRVFIGVDMDIKYTSYCKYRI
jgi:hypothetical protein